MKTISVFSAFSPQKMPKGAHRSQATVEFALSVPILLMVVFGIIDFSLLMESWLTIQNVSRQASRYAITGEYDPTYCVDGPDVGAVACDSQSEQMDARLASIHAIGNNYRTGTFFDEAKGMLDAS